MVSHNGLNPFASPHIRKSGNRLRWGFIQNPHRKNLEIFR